MTNLKPAAICRICAGGVWPIYANTDKGVYIFICEDCKTIIEEPANGVSVL